MTGVCSRISQNWGFLGILGFCSRAQSLNGVGLSGVWVGRAFSGKGSLTFEFQV